MARMPYKNSLSAFLEQKKRKEKEDVHPCTTSVILNAAAAATCETPLNVLD